MASKATAISSSEGDFDSDPDWINCENGLVDLRTGKLIERSPDDLVMKLAPVAYRPEAKCPRFEKFLADLFPGDPEVVEWLQRALGYCLTGRTDEQVLFMAYGTGANGKTTLFETLQEILSDYMRSVDFETFLAGEKGGARGLEAIGRLDGIRLALASETNSNRRFDEALVKKLTGGDTLVGGGLYRKSYEFQPKFKIWLLANHLPIAKDGSHGFWRRVKVLPFTRQFSDAERDNGLRDKLRAEKEGILAWCIRGAIEWYRRSRETEGGSGLGSCRAVDEATSQYRSDNDLFSHFLEERVERAEGKQVRAGELYDAYRDWCRTNGEQEVSAVFFGNRMAERGYLKRRVKMGNVYLDIQLRPLYGSVEF